MHKKKDNANIDLDIASGNALIIAHFKAKLFDKLLNYNSILSTDPKIAKMLKLLKEKQAKKLKSSFSKQKGMSNDKNLQLVIE